MAALAANGDAAKKRPPKIEELMTGPEGLRAADYANYFSSYAYIYHQKQMLTDSKRMEAYRDAILGNAANFRDKVVLDVGAGSGILSIWAAKAGAKKVIACEFTEMAAHARRLVKANGLEDVVDVRRSAVEALDLEKGSVDIIISEWMGYFLLRESMLDSVIYARDRYLKPGGALYPSHAKMYWCPVALQDDRDAKLAETADTLAEWDAFEDEMMREHDVDVRVLRRPYEEETRDYCLRQAQWHELTEDVVQGEPVCVAAFDLNTITLDEAQGVADAPFAFDLPLERCSAFAGWFDSDFAGSPSAPASNVVTLDTSPSGGYTHWGQQCFFVDPTLVRDAIRRAGGRAPLATKGRLSLTRQAGAARLYDVHATIETEDGGGGERLALKWGGRSIVAQTTRRSAYAGASSIASTSAATAIKMRPPPASVAAVGTSWSSPNAKSAEKTGWDVYTRFARAAVTPRWPNDCAQIVYAHVTAPHHTTAVASAAVVSGAACASDAAKARPSRNGVAAASAATLSTANPTSAAALARARSSASRPGASADSRTTCTEYRSAAQRISRSPAAGAAPVSSPSPQRTATPRKATAQLRYVAPATAFPVTRASRTGTITVVVCTRNAAASALTVSSPTTWNRLPRNR